VHPCRWLTKLDAGNRGIEGTGYGESVPCWVVGGERFSCPSELVTEFGLSNSEIVCTQDVENRLD
jgi:hypothetical protein